MSIRTLLVALLLSTAASLFAQAGDNGVAARQAILPPLPPWNGKSQSLIASKQDPWITPTEQSDFSRTPSYDETVQWLERLVAESPELEMISLGASDEGRKIWMVIASKEHAFTPEALRATGKPILLAQAGIHAGEIDGKDAGMMLLRDMTLKGKKKELLDGANLLFVPILSVDGHERSSPYTRINQRGPVNAGWRTNSRNFNLNRDYGKLDTPEVQAIVRAINEWDPDLYIDLHVTDGADYQYDITFGYVGKHAYSPACGAWFADVLSPALNRSLKEMDHVPGPLIFATTDNDPLKGITEWAASPRFSTTYGDARHLPALLVENHSLKPFKQRVLGTYVLLESTMRILATEGKRLREAIQKDRSRRPAQVTLTWHAPQNRPPDIIELLGIESHTEFSSVTNTKYTQWNGKPVKKNIPVVRENVPELTVAPAKAYWIPGAWREVISRLETHGIQMERLVKPREVEVEMYRIKEYKLGNQPYEGHVTVTGTPTIEKRRQTYQPGAVRVSTDQPLGELAVLLLEPQSPESFFQWGFFLETLTPTEYVEEYVMQPMAERMLAQDANLRATFEAKLQSDSTFAANPSAKLQWFYQQTPFFDPNWGLYPVGREL